MVGELREFSAFFGSKKPLFESADVARAGLICMMAHHLVLVAERDGALVGFIAGMVTPHPYNAKIRVLSETFWWVTPAARGTRAGAVLLVAFVTWGKANVDWITLALETSSPINEDALTKRGFRLFERNYLLEVTA